MIRLRQLAARNLMQRGLCLALLVAFCGFSRPAAAQGSPYTFTKLQVPGSVYTDATGINNSGKVVGTYYASDGLRHGYVFDGSTYTTIDYPGAQHTFLFGIDASGRTVGSYSLSVGGTPWHSLVREGGSFTAFDYPNRETDARGINGAGRIVGVYNSGPGTPDFGYLKIDDAYESISVQGSQHVGAFGINDANKISGSYMSADGLWHGFLQTGGNLTTVNVPLASQTFVGGINNADTVVGWSQKGSNAPRAFLLSGFRLRTFDVNLPGVIAASQAQALNDSGQVVGNYYGSGCPNGCGFLATPQVGGVPACDQSLTLQYSAGTLKMKFAGFRTSAPYTWSVLLFALNTWVPVGSATLQPVSPAVAFETSFAFPAVGNVVGLSMFTGATGEVACADFATVNATN